MVIALARSLQKISSSWPRRQEDVNPFLKELRLCFVPSFLKHTKPFSLFRQQEPDKNPSSPKPCRQRLSTSLGHVCSNHQFLPGRFQGNLQSINDAVARSVRHIAHIAHTIHDAKSALNCGKNPEISGVHQLFFSIASACNRKK